MERSATDPDTFLASFDDDVGADMQAIDRLVVAAMPGRCRVLWEGKMWGGTDQTIIGYGDIVQPRPRGDDVEWFLVGLARQKANYSLYVNAVQDGRYLGQIYADRLTIGSPKVKIGAASIGFKRLDVIDLDLLSELVALAHQLTPPDRS